LLPEASASAEGAPPLDLDGEGGVFMTVR
jgi:hypothetical protein